ncbi:MAG: two-component system sensor histidine kinase NtrB [Alphaproteobacteria bacterium]
MTLDSNLILDALPHPVLVVDKDNKVVAANPAGEDLLQHSLESLRGTVLSDYIPEDNPLISLLDVARSRQNSASEFDIRLESPRIGEHLVTAHVSPILHDRTLEGAVIISLLPRGMTATLDQQLTNMNAGRSMSSMGSMLAHEIKNPLAGMKGAAQLLSLSIEDEEDRQLTALIEEEADRISSLIERMESFGNFESGVAEAVNIHEVLNHVLTLAENSFGASVTFHRDFDPSLPAVAGHKDSLIQVILNLVKNACEAVPEERGEVTLSTRYRLGTRVAPAGSGERVELPLHVMITDNGPGIPETLGETVFDPFVTSNKAKGTGLGLALVSKLTDDMGGFVDFESEPGKTVFRLQLPMY